MNQSTAPDGQSSITIDVEKSGPLTVARVSGELDGSCQEEFLDTMVEFVSASKAKLVLDLAGLKTVDSSGLAALINLATRARLGGGNVALVSPAAFVKGVMQATRLDSWFDIFESMELARESLEGA
jgi:anti-sigma B factor antagonist